LKEISSGNWCWACVGCRCRTPCSSSRRSPHRLLNNRLPTENLYSSAELNALAAAYTAWVAGCQPEKISAIGHEEEGFIYLPTQTVVGFIRE
jgi:hypothetical protein